MGNRWAVGEKVYIATQVGKLPYPPAVIVRIGHYTRTMWYEVVYLTGEKATVPVLMLRKTPHGSGGVDGNGNLPSG